MKTNKITRRSFLLGLGAAAAASALTACGGSSSSTAASASGSAAGSAAGSDTVYRTLDEIKADIYALEQETEGLLEQIVGEAE